MVTEENLLVMMQTFPDFCMLSFMYTVLSDHQNGTDLWLFKFDRTIYLLKSIRTCVCRWKDKCNRMNEGRRKNKRQCVSTLYHSGIRKLY